MTATANPGGTALPVINPDWLRKPSGDEFADVFPPKALADGVGGRATISCTVTIDGDLRDCLVVSEEPLGYGFGEAALEMAPSFKMHPAIADGARREGTVRIPIVFSAPETGATEGPSAFGVPVVPAAPAIDPALGVALIGGAIIVVLALFALHDRLRAAAPKAPLGSTLRDGFAFVVRAWRRAPFVLLACLTAAASHYYLEMTYGEESPWTLLALFPQLVLIFMAYGACYRVALGDLVPGRHDLRLGPLGFRLGSVEGRIFAASLVVGFVVAFAAIALLGVGLLIVFGARMAWPDMDSSLLAAALVLIGAVAVVYLWARLFVVLPAAIHKVDTGYFKSWRLTRGAVFTAILAALVQSAVGVTPEAAAGLIAWAGASSIAAATWTVGVITVLALGVALPLYVGLTSSMYLAVLDRAKKP